MKTLTNNRVREFEAPDHLVCTGRGSLPPQAVTEFATLALVGAEVRLGRKGGEKFFIPTIYRSNQVGNGKNHLLCAN